MNIKKSIFLSLLSSWCVIICATTPYTITMINKTSGDIKISITYDQFSSICAQNPTPITIAKGGTAIHESPGCCITLFLVEGLTDNLRGKKIQKKGPGYKSTCSNLTVTITEPSNGTLNIQF
jgi:hypothetical protein